MDILRKMGFEKDAKLLIIHADDAGLCHSENLATIGALEKGSVNSCSIMPTCPWFDEMADYVKNNPQIDYGIHLTLTCEWAYYKWSPILSKTAVPSLVNKDGYFNKGRKDVQAFAQPHDIKIELKAQIEKVYNFGLNPTHLDCHMFTLSLKPEFLDIYRDLGAEYKLPILLNAYLIETPYFNNKTPFNESDFTVNSVIVGHWDYFEKGELAKFYANSLDNLQEGLNVILIHPAFDNDEMRGICVNHPNFGAAWRQIDFDFFTSEECQSKIAQNNIQMFTWRDIKNVLYPA